MQNWKTLLIVAAIILVIQAITIVGVWQIYSLINPYQEVVSNQPLNELTK
jgi:hypothetical protein